MMEPCEWIFTCFAAGGAFAFARKFVRWFGPWLDQKLNGPAKPVPDCYTSVGVTRACGERDCRSCFEKKKPLPRARLVSAFEITKRGEVVCPICRAGVDQDCDVGLHS